MATSQKPRVVEGSCWQCKRRRVKCGLERPACSRCQGNGMHCNYGSLAPIKWVGGVACRGRNAPLNPPGEHHPGLPQDQTSCTGFVTSPTSPSWDAEGLLMYFANAVLPRFQLIEEALPLDLEAIMEDHTLQQAIMAVSRAHYDTFSHATSSKSLLSRRRARHITIHMLRQRLELGPDAATTAEHLFPVNVLLCMLDGMIEPTEQSNASVCHLKGGYALLIHENSNIQATMLARGGLPAHLLSIFATMDLVHALLGGEKPYFDPFIWHMFSETQAWFGRLDNDDRFLELLKTFSEMAILGYTVRSKLPSHDGLRLVQRCLSSIESMLSKQAHSQISPTSNPGITSTQWRRFCALYELAAQLYMYRALRMLAIDDDIVQTATRQGVELLVERPLPGMLAHCTIFPILIIGAHATYAQDRRAILEAITPSKDYLSFGNLQVMTELLRDHWARSGPNTQLDWWQCFRSFAGHVFLF